MAKRKWILPVLLSAVLVILGSYISAWLLMPPRADYGATWESYRKEDKNTIDVLYFGSSLVYCNVVPSVVWEQSGITSYACAGPEQTLPLSYYYIKEACRTQNPKVVVLEATGLFYPKYLSFSKVNVSYMPFTFNRLGAAFFGAEKKLWPGLMLPILDYHSLYQSADRENIKKHLHPQTDIFAGYTYLEDIKEQTKTAEREYYANTPDYNRNLEYLKKIYQYCQKQNIRLVLMITPTNERIPQETMEQMKKDIANFPNAVFVDFNKSMDRMGIDNSKDWYDSIHFNCRGAEKFSKMLAGYLSEELGLSKTENIDTELWQQRAAEFNGRLSALK